MSNRFSVIAALLLAVPVFGKLPKGSEHPKLPAGITIADWARIRAEYERHRHGVFPDESSYVARSFEQQWLTRFEGRGFLVTPDQCAGLERNDQRRTIDGELELYIQGDFRRFQSDLDGDANH